MSEITRRPQGRHSAGYPPVPVSVWRAVRRRQPRYRADSVHPGRPVDPVTVPLGVLFADTPGGGR